jgi:hypothetical protein
VTVKKRATRGRPKAPAKPARAPRGRGLGPTPGALRVVPGRPARPKRATPAATPRSFPQARDGSDRQKLLFELVRARVAVNAAVQGIEPGSATEKTAAGITVREHVLRIAARDRAALRAAEAALLGEAPPWAELNARERDAYHATAARELAALDWNDALRRLHHERDALMDALESVPETGGVWDAAHPFGALVRELAGDDRRHADLIKSWRTSRDG